MPDDETPKPPIEGSGEEPEEPTSGDDESVEDYDEFAEDKDEFVENDDEFSEDDDDEFAEDYDEFADDDDEFAEDGNEETGSKMSFLDHLDELRVRLVRVAYGLIIGFVICYIFKEQIYFFLTQPLQGAALEGVELVYLDPTEAFFTYIKVAFLAGLVLTSPWLFYQLWRFISPGLYSRERRLAWPFVLSSSGLFMGGAIFCFMVVFPFAFTFLRSFETQPTAIDPSTGAKQPTSIVEMVRTEVAEQIKSQGGESGLASLTPVKRGEIAQQIEDRVLNKVIKLVGKEELEPGTLQITAQFTMRNYLSFVSTLLLAFGVIFETPLVLVFLGRLGVVTSKGLRKKRKYAILGMFVVSAIFTPPDVVTQVLMAFPLVALYEISILLVAGFEKKRKEAADEWDPDASDEA